jgi:hypothetical protein
MFFRFLVGLLRLGHGELLIIENMVSSQGMTMRPGMQLDRCTGLALLIGQ